MKEEIKIEELSGIELLKLIYEEVKNNREEIKKELNEKIDMAHKELNERIDTVYKELNEKIDNTKNTLVKEISEEFKTFYEVSEKTTNNLNKKIEDEIEDRKVDFSKIKEFNKIIINDVRSRVSILEEESEKYNLK